MAIKRGWELTGDGAYWLHGADSEKPATPTGYEVEALQPDDTVKWVVIVPAPPSDYATVDYVLGINPLTGRPAWRLVSGVTFDAGFGSSFGGGFGEG